MKQTLLSFITLFVVLLNVPGQIAYEPDLYAGGQYGPSFPCDDQCEHGWPVKYLWRDRVWLNGPPYSRLSNWRVLEGVKRFHMCYLIVDVTIGLALVSLFARLFDAWERQRKRLLQYNLRDLFVGATLVAACLTAFVYHRSEYNAEQGALKSLGQLQDSSANGGTIHGYQYGGPTWMRPLIGDQMFRVFFDRVVEIDISNNQELAQVANFRHLKVVHVSGDISNSLLKVLERLPELEALDMLDTRCWSESRNTDDSRSVRLPRLRSLRGLNLYGATFCGEGLDNLPSIEVLDLSYTGVDDGCVKQLAALTNLKELRLSGTAISDSQLDWLKRELPECKIVRGQ